MKHLFILLLSAICCLSLNAETPVSNEPVKTDKAEKAAVALYLKSSKQDRLRSTAFNAPTFCGYYYNGIFSCDMLNVANEETNCIVTISDTVINTTASELVQGIYIGEYDSAEIEIHIPDVGIFVGVF